MTREDVANAFSESRGDALVVVSPGATNGLLYQANPHPATVYNMELGYSSAFAFGLAAAMPDRKVIAFEGDGSLCAGITSIGTIVRYQLPNLTVLVLANGIWGTGDGCIETTVRPHQLIDIARAWGWDPNRAIAVSEPSALRNALQKTHAVSGPWFITALVARSGGDASYNRPLTPVDAVSSIHRLREYLALQP